MDISPPAVANLLAVFVALAAIASTATTIIKAFFEIPILNHKLKACRAVNSIATAHSDNDTADQTAFSIKPHKFDIGVICVLLLFILLDSVFSEWDIIFALRTLFLLGVVMVWTLVSWIAMLSSSVSAIRIRSENKDMEQIINKLNEHEITIAKDGMRATVQASVLGNILRDVCEHLGISPDDFDSHYDKLRNRLHSEYLDQVSLDSKNAAGMIDDRPMTKIDLGEPIPRLFPPS